MPRYEYRCSLCEHREEVIHSIHADPEVTCVECGETMRRVPQVPLAIARSPIEVMYAWMDENYRRFRARKKGKRAPKFSPDHINSPEATSRGRRR